MTVDIDDEIDKCLKKLSEAKGCKLFTPDLYEGFMRNVPHVTDQTMIDKGLIVVNKDLRMLTSFGIEVSQQGGWKSYLDKKKEKDKIESKRLRLQDLKLQYDLKVSKFLARSKAWPLIISCVSLLLSIYSVFREPINDLVQRLFSFFN